MNPDLPTLNSVAENQPKDLVTETQTPQIEIKQADRPSYDVPIMIEITQQDLNQAAPYGDCHNCLIATVLKRIGYKIAGVGSREVTFRTDKGLVDFVGEIRCTDLGWDSLKEQWTNSALYKQIILYPANT